MCNKFIFFKHLYFKYFFKKKNGINNKGQITVRYKSSKKKKLNILYDNSKNYFNSLNVLLNILKFKNNKPFLGLFKFFNGSFFYSFIQHGNFVGQMFQTNYLPIKFQINLLPGLRVPLKFLKSDYIFCFININKKKFKFYCSAAGTFSKIIEQKFDYNITKIILSTGKLKFINNNNFVTLGRNSNIYNFFQIKSNAKSLYYFNKKSKVRGVAMNPVDHPHGGRTKTNKPECSPWGWITKKNC